MVTDLNQPMLDHAAARQGPTAGSNGGRPTRWRCRSRIIVSMSLAASSARCFFPTGSPATGEARRVLKPGGHFVFNVWDRIDENDFADVVTERLATVFPQDPPRFLARTPHGYHDVAMIREELSRAGFAAVADRDARDVSRAPSPRDPATAYCQGTPLRNEIEARDPSGLEAATQACTEALALRFGSGPVEGRIRAHVITAIR